MDKQPYTELENVQSKNAAHVEIEDLTKQDLHEIDQQEGHMNNGVLGGNFSDDKTIDINKNLENSPTH